MIKEVLLYYDEPIIYTREENNILYLVYKYSESKYYILEISEERLEKLKNKEIDIYTVLVHPEKNIYVLKQIIGVNEKNISKPGIFL